MSLRPRLEWIVAATLALTIAASVPPAVAMTLIPGRFVMLVGGPRLVEIDPFTQATSEIPVSGTFTHPLAMAVTRQGAILVSSRAFGVMRVDPVSGTQSIIAPLDSLHGGAPTGLAVTADGDIYLSMQYGTPRIVQLAPGGAYVREVTSGGLLNQPEGMTFGLDGQLYVCEARSPVISIYQSGSIVRVDPRSGAQTQVAAGSTLYRPHLIAVAPDGALWTAGYGTPTGYPRNLVRTTLPDGTCYDAAGSMVDALAANSSGVLVYTNCDEAHLSCINRYMRVYNGPYFWDWAAVVAAVPDLATPARAVTWGRVKTLYR